MLRKHNAFTLIELMVSIAIIFLLIATASVALKMVRKGANRTESSQALRQMMQAYINYATEHNGRLLPGYPDPNDLAPPPPTLPGMIDIQVRNPLDNAQYLNTADKAPYVWRLAKYLDGGWKTMMTDYRDPAFNSRLNAEFSNGRFGPGSIVAASEIGIASHPAYGLNSIFLGGDSFHGGANVINRSPWNTAVPPNKPIAALRLSDAKSPEKIIVFAPTEAHDYPALQVTKQTQLRLGSAELRPPWGIYDRETGVISQPQWHIDPTTSNYVKTGDFSNGGGLPTDRLDEDKILLSHLDGSVNMMKREDIAAIGGGGMTPAAQLRIMSFWSPFAISDK